VNTTQTGNVGKHKAKHFAGTPVPAHDLTRLGKFLTDVANLKKSDATKSVVVLPDNGTVVTEAVPGSGNSTGDINERSQASNA
jgi:hypothetical protein